MAQPAGGRHAARRHRARRVGLAAGRGQSRDARRQGADRDRRSVGGIGRRRHQTSAASARAVAGGQRQIDRRRRSCGRRLPAVPWQGAAGDRLRHRRRRQSQFCHHRQIAGCELSADRLLGGADRARAEPQCGKIRGVAAPGSGAAAGAGRWIGGIAVTAPAQIETAHPPAVQLHPLSRRIMHWINALAILVMIASGWRIYNYYPALSLHFGFPLYLTLGGKFTVDEAMNNDDGLANALAWHFAAMWVLVLNFLAYLIVGLCVRALSPRFPSGRPGRLYARFFGGAARPARPSAGRIQRRAKGVLLGGSGGHPGDDPVRPQHLEAGAAAIPDLAVRRLRNRPRRAFLRHGGDRRISGGPSRIDPAGAENPGRDDLRRRLDPRRIRGKEASRDPFYPRSQIDRDRHRAPRLSAADAEPGRADPADRLRYFQPGTACKPS